MKKDVDPDSTDSSTTCVTVQNEYEGKKQVLVRAQRNDKPFIQQEMIVLHDHVQFAVDSFSYIAWNCSDKKEGETFKSSTYSNSSHKINLLATNIVVIVSYNGNVIEATVTYPSSDFHTKVGHRWCYVHLDRCMD